MLDIQFHNGNMLLQTSPSGLAGHNATSVTRFYIANLGNIGVGTSNPLA